MPDIIGRTLGGYRIIEKIGLGGMATVFKAYQPSMDRYVALKVLSTHITRDSTFIKRFEQEAKVIARLEHAHILPVYDHGEEDGYLYLVMRFVEAGTLKNLLEQGPLSLEETHRIVTQVGSALEYAHRQGIIHRDLKPSNVLIDLQGNCYLTDFGIAKLVEGTASLTGSGIIGTPHYMAPEQGQGIKVDHRADIYAMGVVIYQIVTGQLPFDAETPIAVMLKHITETLPSPRSIKPDLPEAVERVILKALAKSPTDRYQSIGDLVVAFDRARPPAPPKAPTTAPQSLHRAIPVPTINDEGDVSAAVVVSAPAPETTVAEEADAPSTGVVPATAVPATAPLRNAAGTIRVRRPWAAVGLLILLLAIGAVWVLSRDGSQQHTVMPTSVESAPAAQGTPTTLPTTLNQIPIPSPTTQTLTQAPTAAAPTPTYTPVPATPTPTDQPTATVTRKPVPPTSTPIPLPTDIPAHTATPTDEPKTSTSTVEPAMPTPTNTPRPVLQVELLHTLRQFEQFDDSGPARRQGINSVAFSPDGSMLAAGTSDNTARLWRVSDGAPLHMLEATYGAGGVSSVGFTPDGTTLAMGLKEGKLLHKVLLWRVSDWTQLRLLEDFPENTGVYNVAFAPDGAVLAAGGPGGILRLWWVVNDTNVPIQTLTGYFAAFSPDGQLLASALEDGSLQLWQVSDWAPLHTLAGHTAKVNGLAFSPDGTILASGAEDNTVRLWRVADRTLLRTLEGHMAGVHGLAFSPDGTILASGSSDGTVRLWQADDGTLLTTLEEHLGDVWSVAFSPDGTMLASASQDGTVNMWSVQR